MNDSQDHSGALHPQREIPEDILRYANEHGITFDLWSPVVWKMLRLRMEMGWGNEKTDPNDHMYWLHWQG